MADAIDAGGSDAEPPKKKGLDFSIFLKHVAEVDTPIGNLYLFPLRDSDIRTFNALSSTDAVERIREFIPCIASLSSDYGLKQERVGIAADQAAKLSDQAVESIAEAYALSNGLRSAREGGKDREPMVRATDEPATAFLDRLLRNEVEEQANQFKKLREHALGSTHSIFDQVRKASLALGDTREQLERLTRGSSFDAGIGRTPSFEIRPLGIDNHMAEFSARMERERGEDREIMRLTGQASSQSAAMLQELEVAARTMLEKLDKRDKEAKQTTKIQLWIAVGSVVVSALLAGASFIQDWRNNKSGDDWQGKVLEELKAANTRSTKLEAEHHALRQKVEQQNLAVNSRGKKPVSPKAAPTKP